ncbi:hydroxyglutarate oxidase [Escherichia coli]|uniref:Hydroxyglutarate oxidase n=1 Tax=Escherichia coli TaxID=562 RepID=A0A485JB53_ECOLX|nr:hydroxyglutarate oxidase [Escherichia coli]
MYDFVIIGGGIIGMSTAMQLIDVYPDARIALLEKESGPACHQTGHNSGVIHAGVYYTPGSLKHSFAWRETAPPKPFAIKTAFAMTTAARCWSPPLNSNGTDVRVVGTYGGEWYRSASG